MDSSRAAGCHWFFHVWMHWCEIRSRNSGGHWLKRDLKNSTIVGSFKWINHYVSSWKETEMHEMSKWSCNEPNPSHSLYNPSWSNNFSSASNLVSRVLTDLTALYLKNISLKTVLPCSSQHHSILTDHWITQMMRTFNASQNFIKGWLRGSLRFFHSSCFYYWKRTALLNMDSDDDLDCPLCMEELDIADRNFRPCPCGYQVSKFTQMLNCQKPWKSL